jgi:hypothetical protein
MVTGIARLVDGGVVNFVGQADLMNSKVLP